MPLIDFQAQNQYNKAQKKISSTAYFIKGCAIRGDETQINLLLSNNKIPHDEHSIFEVQATIGYVLGGHHQKAWRLIKEFSLPMLKAKYSIYSIHFKSDFSTTNKASLKALHQELVKYGSQLFPVHFYAMFSALPLSGNIAVINHHLKIAQEFSRGFLEFYCTPEDSVKKFSPTWGIERLLQLAMQGYQFSANTNTSDKLLRVITLTKNSHLCELLSNEAMKRPRFIFLYRAEVVKHLMKKTRASSALTSCANFSESVKSFV